MSGKIGRDMRGRFLKSFGTICLSILLLYSGVAWALGNCLSESGSVDTDHRPRQEYGAVTSERADPSTGLAAHLPHRPSGKIHCLDSHDLTRLIVGPSSALRLKPFGSGVLVKSFRAAGLASSSEARIAGLVALDWFPPFSLPVSSSRHLFLSVLRI